MSRILKLFEEISYFQVTILGIIQGITEFLPVSSSAHLLLWSKLSGVSYLGKAFDVALHGGTLGALIFAKSDLLKKISQGEGSYKCLIPIVFFATIFPGIFGFLLEDVVEEYFHSVYFLAFSLAFFGLLLWYVDKYFAEDGELQSIDRRQSLLIGLIQSLALLPGVSRLGILLTASRGFHLNRFLAGELALVSSIPIVAGAFFVKLCKGFELPSAEMWPLVIWGILFSFLTGLLGIKLLEFVLRKGSLKYVAVYRLLLALAVLVFCGNM